MSRRATSACARARVHVCACVRVCCVRASVRARGQVCAHAFPCLHAHFVQEKVATYLSGCSAASLVPVVSPGGRLVFGTNWTRVDVSCALSSLWGPASNVRDPPKEVVLPSKLTIDLKSDLGLSGSLKLDGAGVELISGNNTITVFKGGSLSLHNTTVTRSIWHRAIKVMGDAAIVRTARMHTCFASQH